MRTWQLCRSIWTEGFSSRHLSMVNKFQQPQATLRMVEMLYEECGFQLSDDDSASLIETSGLDLNCTRAMIYRDVATWNETYNLVY